jgi:hypothetical protein
MEVDSAVVSPIIKHLPHDGPCAAETRRKLKDTYKYTDILECFNRFWGARYTSGDLTTSSIHDF